MARERRILSPRRLTALVVVLIILGTASTAMAEFLDTDAASQTVSTDALVAPTNPGTASGECTAGVSVSIVVSWTKTSSTWADSYEVLGGLIAGGPYTLSQLVGGRDTESATISGLAFATTYHFVVKATKGNWQSAPTTEVSRTTLSAACL